MSVYLLIPSFLGSDRSIPAITPFIIMIVNARMYSYMPSDISFMLYIATVIWKSMKL